MAIDLIEMIYTTQDITIDTEQFQLLKNNCPVDIEPKVFDLVVYLVERRNKVISRDVLIDHLWPDMVVSDASLANAIKGARKSLGDDGKQQKWIKTIHGRGYQFVADVEENSESEQASLSHSAVKNQAAGPLIAVLQLQNMSSDQTYDYLAEGLSEDLTTELSRFKNLQVMARHTAFKLGRGNVDFKKMRQDYRIEYLIEGSIRPIGESFRINIQLIDTQSGNHVWAEIYQDSFQNIYSIQDHIIEQVVAVVASEIMRVETGHSMQRSSENLRAYDYFLRGMYFHRTSDVNTMDHNQAMVEFQKAINLDGGFARARVWYCCARFATWNELTEARLQQQIDDVCVALNLNPGESECHRLLGILYHYQGRDQLAASHHAQALKLSPNDAYINIKSALFLALSGENKKALELAQRAVFLNPLHPSWYWRDLGIVYYANRDFQLALNAFEQNIQAHDADLALIAVCYVASGQKERAQSTVVELMKKMPGFNVPMLVDQLRFKDTEHNDLLTARMLEAGIPA